MTSRNCAGVSRVAGTAVPFPALLTRTSTCPNSLIAASTTAEASSGRARSAATVMARRPACSAIARVASRRSARRAASTRSAPASASALANATPRPEEAPVTIATLPSSRKRSSTVVMSVLSLKGARYPLLDHVAGSRPELEYELASAHGERDASRVISGTAANALLTGTSPFHSALPFAGGIVVSSPCVVNAGVPGAERLARPGPRRRPAAPARSSPGNRGTGGTIRAERHRAAPT